MFELRTSQDTQKKTADEEIAEQLAQSRAQEAASATTVVTPPAVATPVEESAQLSWEDDRWQALAQNALGDPFSQQLPIQPYNGLNFEVETFVTADNMDHMIQDALQDDAMSTPATLQIDSVQLGFSEQDLVCNSARATNLVTLH